MRKGEIYFMANEELKSLMKRTGVSQFELGRTLGKAQPTISYMLRFQMTEDEKEEIKKAILATSRRLYGEII